jgi:feruloyl-CoA synthase
VIPAGSPRRRVRPVNVLDAAAEFRDGPGGTVYVRSPRELGPYPRRLTDRLEQWAAKVPGRVFLAQRGDAGAWRELTYADALTRARSIAEWLLRRRVERPVAILSENSIEHALLGLACMHAGIPYAPMAPSYSLASSELTTLRFLLERLEPAIVFAADGARFERPLALAAAAGAGVVTVTPAPRIHSTPFDELAATVATPQVDDARARVGPDTVAKILFTSGSTGHPKGVITTQRMLCSNQKMLSSVLAFVRDEPPVLCDWLPWNHTFGGSHNFGLALYNGGTLFIDEGKPMEPAFRTTVRNLREIPPTAYFNVPKGYEMLVPALREDAELARRFFSRLKIVFYAAAGLNQRVWDDLQDIAVQTCGEEILMVTGLGATESAPMALATGIEGASAGRVGLPVPGVELKLAPVNSKVEARLRGPNITPGYWRDPEMTRAAFDEEGFYRLGDAVVPVDSADPLKGYLFNGRLTEDFKLSTGTWVSVGPLRESLLKWCAGAAQDVVIAAPDRDYVAALIFPAGGTTAAELRTLLEGFARKATGISNCIRRAIVVSDPPSMDAGELTEKGSINQKAVLRNRAGLVEELYAGSPRVIEVEL